MYVCSFALKKKHMSELKQLEKHKGLLMFRLVCQVLSVSSDRLVGAKRLISQAISGLSCPEKPSLHIETYFLKLSAPSLFEDVKNL